MGFLVPKQPQIVQQAPPPPPERKGDDVADALAKERKRRAGAVGFSDTILTGSGGDQSDPNLGTAVLLGGGGG